MRDIDPIGYGESFHTELIHAFESTLRRLGLSLSSKEKH